MTARLAFIGAGMMGEALARGLIASGWSPDELVLADVRPERVEEVASLLGTQTTTDPAKAAAAARGTLLAVKPQDAASAIDEIAGSVGEAGLVSIVAGLPTSTIEQGLGGEPSVVRAMPNTPARVGKGVTALATGRFASEATRELASDIFSAVGPVVWLYEEQLDAVTAVSGSGPAYVFYLAEAMVEAGVELGLEREVAETLTFATIEGAGRMLVETGEKPAVLRKQVTSPGGTTEAAIGVLDERDVAGAFAEALAAAKRRSKELGS
jgi:pyrroline-5-carboxylate reductase